MINNITDEKIKKLFKFTIKYLLFCFMALIVMSFFIRLGSDTLCLETYNPTMVDVSQYFGYELPTHSLNGCLLVTEHDLIVRKNFMNKKFLFGALLLLGIILCNIVPKMINEARLKK